MLYVPKFECPHTSFFFFGSFVTCFLRSFPLFVSFYPLYIARESSFVFFIWAKLANQLVWDCSRILFWLCSKFCIVCQSISHKNPEIHSLRGKEEIKHQKDRVYFPPSLNSTIYFPLI